MYLGCRYTSQQLEEQVLFRAIGQYADAVSINYYSGWAPDSASMTMWEHESGKPFIITEFYVKAEDSGMPNHTGAGWLVHSQADRGFFYQNFVLTLLQSGKCVGWHWFKYQDNDPLDPSRGAFEPRLQQRHCRFRVQALRTAAARDAPTQCAYLPNSRLLRKPFAGSGATHPACLFPRQARTSGPPVGLKIAPPGELPGLPATCVRSAPFRSGPSASNLHPWLSDSPRRPAASARGGSGSFPPSTEIGRCVPGIYGAYMCQLAPQHYSFTVIYRGLYRTTLVNSRFASLCLPQLVKSSLTGSQSNQEGTDVHGSYPYSGAPYCRLHIVTVTE